MSNCRKRRRNCETSEQQDVKIARRRIYGLSKLWDVSEDSFGLQCRSKGTFCGICLNNGLSRNIGRSQGLTSVELWYIFVEIARRRKSKTSKQRSGLALVTCVHKCSTQSASSIHQKSIWERRKCRNKFSITIEASRG